MNKIKDLRSQLSKKPDDKFLQKNLAAELYTIIIDYSREDAIKKMEEYIIELEELALSSKIDEIAKIYGQALLNTMPIFFAQSTITDIKNKINGLRENAHKLESKILFELLSMILVNAIYDFSLINQIPSIHEFAMELIDLSRVNSNNINIQTAAAKGMMNATMYFLQRNDKQAARNYFDYLDKIAKNNPKTEMVDTRQLLLLREHFKD
ncbi:MAG: hypothetical protein FK734_05520 [Asgard group archaeon]|nr:hypothetical protein [Asgard group archaeon]